MPSISIKNTTLTSGSVPSGGSGSFGPIPSIVNNIQDSILIANEDSSITGHSNSSLLIPERIDLSGIDLSGIGGVVPSVLIDNIYNSNKIQEWTYAYNKTIQSIDVIQSGSSSYTLRIYFLDGTYVQDSFNVSGDKNYVHDQQVASSTWVVNHNLSKFASVGIVDTAGDEVEGEVRHNSDNQVTITFSSPISGKAYIN